MDGDVEFFKNNPSRKFRYRPATEDDYPFFWDKPDVSGHRCIVIVEKAAPNIHSRRVFASLAAPKALDSLGDEDLAAIIRAYTRVHMWL